MWDSTDFIIVVSPAFNRSWFYEHVLRTTTEFLYHMYCQHWLQLVHPTDGNEIQHEKIDHSCSTFLISQIKSVVEWMILKEVTEDLTLLILLSSFMFAVLPCLPAGHACPTSPALISFRTYSTLHWTWRPHSDWNYDSQNCGQMCLLYCKHVVSSVCVNCYSLQQHLWHSDYIMHIQHHYTF